MGKTPARNNSEYWNEGKHDWISIRDLSGFDKYVGQTKEQLSDLAIEESGIKAIPSNTVVMSFKLSIGKVAITTEKSYSNEAIMAFIDKKFKEISVDYLYYLLKNKDWSEGLNKAVMGITLNKATLSEIKIRIHEIHEQKKIVTILDKVSELIILRKQQIDELDKLIKSRFVEMFGDLEYSNKKLISIIQKGAGLSYGIIVPGEYVETGIPMIRPSDFKNGNLVLDNVYKVECEIEKKYAKTRLIGEELLVQVIGQPGQVMLTNKECFGMNVTRNLAVVRHDARIVNKYYLKQYLLTQEAQHSMLGGSNQSTLKQLPLGTLKDLTIPIPPIEMQNSFGDFIIQVDKLKIEVQKSLDETQILLDSLMQEYFG